MYSARSNRAVPNQYIITEDGRGANGNFLYRETFQSYESIIAVRTVWEDDIDIVLDEKYWNYSTTTSKYRNDFLDENTADTKKKIADGTYKLDNLNKGKE